jgi:hypothetical protein
MTIKMLVQTLCFFDKRGDEGVYIILSFGAVEAASIQGRVET